MENNIKNLNLGRSWDHCFTKIWNLRVIPKCVSDSSQFSKKWHLWI